MGETRQFRTFPRASQSSKVQAARLARRSAPYRERQEKRRDPRGVVAGCRAILITIACATILILIVLAAVFAPYLWAADRGAEA